MQSANLHYFINHFLISTILYKGNTLINFGFFTKEDFWYAVSISAFTGLNVCILLSFVCKILAQTKKSHKVDTITSILQKIRNSIKFEPLLQFQPNLKTELPRFYLKLYRPIWLKTWISRNFLAKIPFFWTIYNFMKSERIDGFFPNLIPDVSEYWSLYKELFSSTA